MVAPVITTLPAAPDIADPANFPAEASVFVAALAPLQTELNAFGTYLNTGDFVVAGAYRQGPSTVFNTAVSGTYTVPADCRALLVEIVGSGGGGGGATFTGTVARAASGGGAGPRGKDFIAAPAASYSYAVGGGGAGGAAGNNNGSDGGTTTFGAYTALGGGGGATSGTSTATASIGSDSATTAKPSGGLSEIFGVRGTRGFASIKLTAADRAGGSGANGVYGAGGGIRTTASSTVAFDGLDASGNGAGGGGGISSTTVGGAGGAGAPGQLIITPLY
jgi:hypothetical protein